jgi:hypothetical protein
MKGPTAAGFRKQGTTFAVSGDGTIVDLGFAPFGEKAGAV